MTRIRATHISSTSTPIYQCTACRISSDCYYRYMDARYTVISCSHITVTYAHRTSVHTCIVSIFLSYESPFILYVLLFHVIPVFLLYDCFPLLILIFPLLDMRAVDMRCVESHIYCSRFPIYCSWYLVHVILFLILVILFYAINRALVQLSCYPYHLLYLFLFHCILDISDHKYNLGMGETWQLTRSYRVDVLDPYC